MHKFFEHRLIKFKIEIVFETLHRRFVARVVIAKTASIAILLIIGIIHVIKFLYG